MVTEQHTQTQRSNGEAYLHQLGALHEEIHAAMLAISGNSLPELEQSLWRQEVLCVSLKHLTHSMGPASVEGSLMLRIQTATAALGQLNATYCKLVEQARSSTNVLYGLCRDYKDSVAMMSLPNHQTFYSCEA